MMGTYYNYELRITNTFQLEEKNEY
jgi:hypothetical protein